METEGTKEKAPSRRKGKCLLQFFIFNLIVIVYFVLCWAKYRLFILPSNSKDPTSHEHGIPNQPLGVSTVSGIQVVPGIQTFSGVQGIPNQPLGVAIVPGNQAISNHLLGQATIHVPSVQGTHFPYGISTLPNMQGIPNQSLGYQVIRPMLYDYSFMYS